MGKLIMNKKELEKNIERANEAVKSAYKDVNEVKDMFDRVLNIQNAAMAVHSAALDNYYSGTRNDSDAYISARNNYNDVCYVVDCLK